MFALNELVKLRIGDLAKSSYKEAMEKKVVWDDTIIIGPVDNTIGYSGESSVNQKEGILYEKRACVPDGVFQRLPATRPKGGA